LINLLDILAWVGAVQILSMYALISTNRIKAKKLYHFFNFSGAAFICIACVIGKVWQAAAVEGIWALMALIFFTNQCIPRKLTREELCVRQFNDANKALEKYEGRPAQEAFEAIKKEFPDYKVYLLGEGDVITCDFDYDRITLINHKGTARSIVVG
jgi:hypothetical protein